MPRPLREHAPETTYHVWIRSTFGLPLFFDNDDRERLLRILKYVCEKYGWVVYAYAFLTTHVHFVIWTEDDNISRGMQLLMGLHVQTLNRKHERHGHLVSSRFGSNIVDTEEYAKEVVRYIVLNPVRAGLCDRPEGWIWSSYRATLGLAPAPPWLDAGWVLRLFDDDPWKARDAFRAFVEAALLVEAGVAGSDPRTSSPRR